jgi:hypothetical protein
MAKRPNRVTEAEVAFATLQIAASRPNGTATYQRLKKELPNYLKLSAEDQAQSLTRPNEELWEQLIRNIKSHSDTPGNIICEGYATHVPRVGYRITDRGRRYLKSKGY